MAAGSPKRVAIIGGGVSGLAAYRHIVVYPSLKPTLFEASSSLGGLWSSEHPHHRSNMIANVSRHTMTFSDMAWPEELSTLRQDPFPRAREVQTYLQLYAERHVREEDLRLSTEVTKVERSGGKWSVTTDRDLVADRFDYLVVATGFFSKPYTPRLPGIDGADMTIQHSADFRTPESCKGKKVAVIGGSLSAVEIAGLLVPYATEIHHVHSKPLFAISHYLPINSPSKDGQTPHFLPLDLFFYRRSIRQSLEEQSHPTPEMNRKRNAFLSSLFPLSSFSTDHDRPPIVGISNQYAAGIRAGVITPHLARLDLIERGQTLKLSSGQDIHSPDIVIFCTGYTTSLQFLSPSLQDAIGYRADDRYVPFLANHLVLHPDLPNAGFVGVYRGPYFAVVELQARYLASLFAGEMEWPNAEDMNQGIQSEARLRESDKDSRAQFPHGDYGGLVENYARLLGLSSHPSCASAHLSELITDKGVEDFILAVNYPLVKTRDVKDIESDILNILGYSLRGGWVSAAVFHSWCGHWKLHRVISDSTSSGMNGTFDGFATFYPRPRSTLPRDPAKLPSSEASCSTSNSSSNARRETLEDEGVFEYLYHEHGTFTTTSGIGFQAHRKYIYRYQPLSDTISAWFCKGPASAEEPNCGELDYWFHDIVIKKTDPTTVNGISHTCRTGADETWFEPHRRKGGWVGTGTEHLCIQDYYRPIYKFCFEGAELREFGIGYDVEGPGKRYVSEAWYERT